MRAGTMYERDVDEPDGQLMHIVGANAGRNRAAHGRGFRSY